MEMSLLPCHWGRIPSAFSPAHRTGRASKIHLAEGTAESEFAIEEARNGPRRPVAGSIPARR